MSGYFPKFLVAISSIERARQLRAGLAGGVCALALAAFATSAIAADPPPGMSQQVFDDVQAIITDKTQWTPEQRKLDPGLIYAAREARGLARVPGVAADRLPRMSAEKQVDSFGFALVDISTTDAAGLETQIQLLNGSVISSFPQYNAVRASVPVTVLEALAAVPSVKSIIPAQEPVHDRIVGPIRPPFEARSEIVRAQLKKALGAGASESGAQTDVGTGSTVSEAVTAHGANIVQNAGVTGAGVKICVMSDGVNTLATRQASGNLPAVQVLAGQAGSGDEGTAMLELVADMAPGATLGFATGNGGEAQFASNILALRNTMNCDIIVDDLSYFTEGAFQEGKVASAVNTVVAAGALHFSSAGNSGHLSGGQSGTWEGDFVNGGAVSGPIATAGETGNFHMFPGSSLFTTLTSAGQAVTLQWADPLGASSNDYDLFITDSTGSTLAAFGAAVQSGAQDPYETIDCSTASNCPVGGRVYLVLFSGAPRALRLDSHRGRLSIATNGSNVNHHAGVNTISVAAVSNNFTAISGRRFLSTDTITTYSSDGPRKLFINPYPATTYITAGCATYGCAGGGGTLLQKVDIAAADCNTTTTPSFIPFCGTSAAAPNAAAIAALVKSAFPSLTNAQVLARLKSTALDIMTAGFDIDSGAGIVMADSAALPKRFDFTGDARADITWRNSNNGEVWQWQMNGATISAGVPVTFNNNPAIVPPASWTALASGDFNGDGISDMLWRDSGGALWLWTMNGGVISASAPITYNNVPVSLSPSAWTLIGAGDFGGDRKMDLLWRDGGGNIWLWTMNGAAIAASNQVTFNNVPAVVPAAQWTLIGLADCDGDGKVDALWRDGGGNIWLWKMNGAVIATSTQVTFNNVPANVPAANWTLLGLADADGDGKADALWRDGSGAVWQWKMNGSVIASSAAVTFNNVAANVPAATWEYLASADLDGDGKADSIWRNTTNAEVWMWKMNGPVISSAARIAPNLTSNWVVQAMK